MDQSVVTRALLAKSRHAGREISLREHLQDTAKSARLIFGLENRVGRNFCRAFGFSDDESKNFLLNLEVACLFHDIGKANEGFADAVEHHGRAQTVRHEHLSALILQLPEVQMWLGANVAIRQPLVIAAVLSHHLKAKYGEIGTVPIGGLRQCRLLFDHPEIREILCDIAAVAELGSAPDLPYHDFSNSSEPWRSLISKIESDGNQFRRRLDSAEGQSDRRMVAALKAALIVADSVASGVIREGGSIEKWLAENLHLATMTQAELTEKIIVPCTNKIQTRTGRPYKPANFQTSAAKLGSRSVLRAGCGSGKTLAAYYWAASQLAHGEYGRVIFLYPTRGTATEGFKDYTGWAPDGEALLLHGSSRYVLESMLYNPPDSAKDKNYLDESNERLYSLANYNRRFFSATVDQFLSFLQFNYPSICMSVILADSVVVLDEVHSFDRRLFNTVLEYLRSMNVPTLCMTATLPTARVKELQNVGMEFFPTPTDMEDLKDLASLEERPRYRVERAATEEEAMERCQTAMTNREKVLWVVNTVDRCQRLAAALKSTSVGAVICYHSRFQLRDRERWHKECVDKFRAGTRFESGIVALTTQVCEMSLDLDADRLITEVAPIPSLVQRMGRANRHLESRPEGFVAPVHVYEVRNALPYQFDELEVASNFVDGLVESGGSGISQAQLAEGLEMFGPTTERGVGPSARLFESGYFAAPADLRDIDEFAVPALLDGELLLAEELVKSGKRIDQLVVPVPSKFALDVPSPSWMPRYLKLAASSLYDWELGFRTKSWEAH